MNSNAATNGSLDALSGVLKDVYMPGVNNTLWFDDKFTRLIESQSAKLDVTGRRIVGYFDTQRSGGVGPIEEGGAFRDSVPIDGFQGYEYLKYSNMYFELTGPAIATVQAGEGSYVDIVDKHLTTLVQSQKKDMERILMGACDGKLAVVNDATPVGTTLSVEGPAFFDTQHLELGMDIEFRAAPANVLNSMEIYSAVRDMSSTGGNTSARITSLTRGNKGFGAAAATRGTMGINVTIDQNVANGDYICRKNSFGALETQVNGCLEQNGLMNLISDGVTNSETTNNYKYIWHKDRTSQTELASYVYNVNDELDEEVLLQVLILAESQLQADPNLFIVTPRALLRYFLNVKEDRRFNTMTAFTWVGGYQGMGIQLGNRQLMLTSLNSVPEGYAFLINTNDFAFMRPVGWNGFRWLTGDSGGVLQQKEGSDQKFATAVDYWQFVCKDPAKQIKLYGIVE